MSKLKKLGYIMIIVAFIWSILFPPLMTFASGSEELLTNGDFEEDGSWEDWGGFTITADSPNVCSGKRAAIIKKEESGAGNIIQNIQPGEMFKLSGYGKVDGIGQEGILGAECLDSNGKKIKDGRFIVRFNTSTYNEKSRTFYTVPGTAQIQVYLYVINLVDGGATYFDNISLTKVESQNYVNRNNGAFLPKDYFDTFQSTQNIKTYVNDLTEKGIKYQFVDIGLLNDDGSINPQNYIALGQWIKNSKKIDPEQYIICIFNYNRRIYTDGKGNKILNPDFGTELFKTNIDSLANKLVNDGIEVDGVRYCLDGISIDFEEFVNDDQTLLDCIKFLRGNSLSDNKYLSICAPINYSIDKTWSNKYISDVASVVNQINPMLYDLMGLDSGVNSDESYRNICKLELKRFSDSIVNTSTNGERCNIFPLIPSYERRIDKNSLSIYHDPQIENVLSAVNSIKDVSGDGVNIYGVGIFWWPTFIGYCPNIYQSSYYLIDQYNWMTYWVNNAS